MLFRTKVAWRLSFIERTLLCKRADWYCKPIFHIEALEKELVMARSHSFFSPAETASGTTLAELSLAMLLISISITLMISRRPITRCIVPANHQYTGRKFFCRSNGQFMQVSLGQCLRRTARSLKTRVVRIRRGRRVITRNESCSIRANPFNRICTD